MAKSARTGIESFSFNGEDAGVSAALALRKVRPLAECAPPGRLFSAIATLADTSAAAALEFEAAGIAELHADAAKSEFHLKRGNSLARRLKDDAARALATPLPAIASLR